MSEALEGEIVTVASVSRRTAERRGELRFQVHYVDLRNGGRVEGMSAEDAVRMARAMGTKAWRAEAVLITQGRRAGLVVVQPPEPMVLSGLASMGPPWPASPAAVHDDTPRLEGL